MKKIKTLFSIFAVISIFTMSGCNLEDSTKSSNSATNSSYENNNTQESNNNTDKETIKDNNSGDVYIIDDGSNIINNQHIEKGSTKPGK